MDLLVGINRDDNITPKSGSGTVTNASNLPYTLGTVWTDPNTEDKFRFVLAEDADISQGDACLFNTEHNGYEVTSDVSGGTADHAFAAGIAVGATGITDGNCGWIQIAGRNTVALVTDGGIVADENVMSSASVDGALDTDSGLALSGLFGWATANDAADSTFPVGAVYLDITQQ